MRFPRSLVALPFALIAILASAGSASAAIPWAACAKPAQFQCATVSEPLDYTGATPGTVNLEVTRRVATVGGSKTAIVALAGGPGQAALPFASDFAKIFGAAALANNDLLVFNQRGTGNSSPISCPAFKSNSGTADKAVQSCSLELGAKRAFYQTSQSVDDLERLRIAGGYDNLIIYGVSYGTKVALDYAARYPATTKSLILDSVVAPTGPDALRRSTLGAVPRVIGQTLCGNNACAAAGGNPVGDLTKLIAKLAKGSIPGLYHSPSGKTYRTSLSVNDLIATLTAGDLNPALRADLPGSVHAALHGDTAPIIRLAVISEGLQTNALRGRSMVPASAFDTPTATASSAASDELESLTLYYATECEEIAFPWTRGASTAQRAAEADAAVGLLPAGTFGIFGNSTAVALGGLPSSCLGWVVGGPAPAAPTALPNVPALILDGEADLRTPVEDAQSVASQLPQAQFIKVPDTGHSVVTAETGNCARDAVVTFLAGGVAAACPAVADQFSPSATPPKSFADVPTARGVSSKLGRTLNGLYLTLSDAHRQVVGEAYAIDALPTSVGGLRAGSVRVVSATKYQFRGYEFVPGLKVTGLLKNGTSSFTISGSKAATGAVKLLSSGAITGTLDGKTFKLRPRASGSRLSAATPDWPSLTKVLAMAKRQID